MPAEHKNNILLWAVLVLCLVYVTLWAVGIRFPPIRREVSTPLGISESDEESDTDVVPVNEPPEDTDDIDVLPEAVTNDGLIPGAPLL